MAPREFTPAAVYFHAWKNIDGDQTHCEEHEGPDGWCVYTRHERTGGGLVGTATEIDVSDEMDFTTRDEAEHEATARAAALGVDAREY